MDGGGDYIEDTLELRYARSAYLSSSDFQGRVWDYVAGYFTCSLKEMARALVTQLKVVPETTNYLLVSEVEVASLQYLKILQAKGKVELSEGENPRIKLISSEL